jgi:hypothetical protein
MKIETGVKQRPRICCIYGSHGIGKSTFASKAERSLFLNYEDGLDEIGPSRTPYLDTYEKHIEAWKWVVENPDSYDWLVIDGIDALELLLIKKVCDDAGVDAINDIGYGVGKQKLRKDWAKFLGLVHFVRDNLKKNVMIVGHDMVITQRDPEHPEYDKHYPKLVNKDFSELLVERCDEVFYVYEDLRFTETKGKFGAKEVTVREGRGVVMRTKGKPAVTAKRRLSMEDVCEFNFEAYQEAISKGVENE